LQYIADGFHNRYAGRAAARRAAMTCGPVRTAAPNAGRPFWDRR
jgi:hypothetical protein